MFHLYLYSLLDDGRATHPASAQEALGQVNVISNSAPWFCLKPRQLIENFSNEEKKEEDTYIDVEDSELVAKAKKAHVAGPDEFSWTDRDIILYNLGVGATEKELQWTYEGHDEFSPIPTYGVIPQFVTTGSIAMDWLPNFNFVLSFFLLPSYLIFIRHLFHRENYYTVNNFLLLKDRYRLKLPSLPHPGMGFFIYRVKPI